MWLASYLCFLALLLNASLQATNSFHRGVDLFSLHGPCGVGLVTPNTLWLHYYDLVTEEWGAGVRG